MQVGDWVKADQTKLIELFSFFQKTPVQMFVQRDIAFPKQNYGRNSIQNLVHSSVVIKANECNSIWNSDMKQV